MQKCRKFRCKNVTFENDTQLSLQEILRIRNYRERIFHRERSIFSIFLHDFVKKKRRSNSRASSLHLQKKFTYWVSEVPRNHRILCHFSRTRDRYGGTCSSSWYHPVYSGSERVKRLIAFCPVWFNHVSLCSRTFLATLAPCVNVQGITRCICRHSNSRRYH